MSLATIIIFLGGMLVGAGVISIVLGLCTASGRSELEEEIMELRIALNKNRELIQMYKNMLGL